MSTTIKISKQLILNSALRIVREHGLEGLNARTLSKQMKCSIRPIYYQFQNMEELKKELLKEITKNFYDFITKNINDSMPAYKQVGIKYIQYAKKEPKFFQILFMSKNNINQNRLSLDNKEAFKIIEKFIGDSTKLENEEIEKFHFKMWIFTHGIATLIASDTCKITYKQIEDLLSYEFQALMLLEENPDNKWTIEKRGFKN